MRANVDLRIERCSGSIVVRRRGAAPGVGWGSGVIQMAWTSYLRRAFGPLRSRKLRVALATVLAAFAAEYGLGADEELILTILGVGVSLILGIAHEDAGRKSAPSS